MKPKIPITAAADERKPAKYRYDLLFATNAANEKQANTTVVPSNAVMIIEGST